MKKLIAGIFLWQVAIWGSIFQGGHFIEHWRQTWHWLFLYRSHAWMSDLAANLSMYLGTTALGHVCGPIVMSTGMELLHLIGNGIFLATLCAWCLLFPSVRWLRWGRFVEALHLTEHISLTSTVLLYGKAVGWSTLFGFAPALLGHDWAVGFRVLWHFGMNLVPSGLMVYGMAIGWRKRLESKVLGAIPA